MDITIGLAAAGSGDRVDGRVHLIRGTFGGVRATNLTATGIVCIRDTGYTTKAVTIAYEESVASQAQSFAGLSLELISAPTRMAVAL